MWEFYLKSRHLKQKELIKIYNIVHRHEFSIEKLKKKKLGNWYSFDLSDVIAFHLLRRWERAFFFSSQSLYIFIWKKLRDIHHILNRLLQICLRWLTTLLLNNSLASLTSLQKHSFFSISFHSKSVSRWFGIFNSKYWCDITKEHKTSTRDI